MFYNFTPNVGTYLFIENMFHFNLQSYDIKYALYATPWSSCKRKYNMLLSIMLLNAEKPIVIQDPWFKFIISLETFGDVS